MSTEKARLERETSAGGVRLTRRDFLKVGGAGLAGATLLGIAGCGGGGPEQESGQQGGGGGGGGDTLIVGYDQEPAILNKIIVGGDLAATSDMVAGIQESILQIQPDLSYQPELAASEPEVVSEDPLTIEYQLRDGLTWSDGEPITSADAKYTFDQIMSEDNQILTREGWDKIESFETPDERTVRITFREIYAPWQDLLSDNWPILPKHVYESQDIDKALNNEVVGSGPYKFKEWRKGQSLTIEANENYWGEKPKIKEVTFRFIPDTNTVITSLQSGEVAFIRPPPDIGLEERLNGIEGATVDSKAGTVWEHIAFNLEEVPSLKLRQAIAYGINRQQVVQELLQGSVNPLYSVLVPEQTPYYTESWEDYSFDPERARQLVQEAEGEGASTTITFSTTSDNRLRETLQEIIQQQLKDVGITVEIKNTAAETFFGEWTPQGKFQMGEWAWLATPDPSVTTLFAADSIPPDGQNYYRYKNDRATELMKESDRTIDEQQRAELLQEVQDIMAQDLPLIPMYQRPEVYAYTENLSGPQVNPTLAGPFWNIGEWSLR